NLPDHLIESSHRFFSAPRSKQASYISKCALEEQLTIGCAIPERQLVAACGLREVVKVLVVRRHRKIEPGLPTRAVVERTRELRRRGDRVAGSKRLGVATCFIHRQMDAARLRRGKIFEARAAILERVVESQLRLEAIRLRFIPVSD